MTTRWISRHPFQWTTSQIRYASPVENVSKGRCPETAKQRPECWSLQCDGAKVITGNTLLGHWVSAYWRNNRLIITKCTTAEKLYVPPDLQVGFDYGSTNKSHALATTLGKTILIFYPGVTFSEYGRHVLQAGSGIYMKVREDGSRVTENDTDEVCFEFKGPFYRIRNIRRMSIIQSPFTIPPKCHTRWPWNTAKIASNVSFTPESSTFIMGNMSKNL